MIMKADKGNATVVMVTDVYEWKMHENLSTTGSYRKLVKNPSAKIMNKVKMAILMSNLDDNTKKRLIPKSSITPKIYGLPKIHKDGIPLRPIVNTIGSTTYLLAKFLAKSLKPLVGHIPSYIKDSSHFIDGLKTYDWRIMTF